MGVEEDKTNKKIAQDKKPALKKDQPSKGKLVFISISSIILVAALYISFISNHSYPNSPSIPEVNLNDFKSPSKEPYLRADLFKNNEYLLATTKDYTDVWRTSPKQFIKKINKCSIFAFSHNSQFFLCAQNDIVAYFTIESEVSTKVLTQKSNALLTSILITDDDTYVVFSYREDDKEGIEYKQIAFNKSSKKEISVLGTVRSLDLKGKNLYYTDDRGNHIFTLP